MSRIGITLGAAALALARSAGTADAFCGFYVEGSGAKLFERRDAGRADARGHAHRAVDAERLQGTARRTSRWSIPVPVVLKESRRQDAAKDVFVAHRAARRAAARRVLGAGPVSRAAATTSAVRARCAMRSTAPMATDRGATRRRRADREDRGEVRRRRVQDRDPVGDGGDGPRAPGSSRTATRSPPVPSRCCGRTSRAGSKFFVAKVDPKKVQMVDGRAALSPLRFHYDSEEFSLPIRLGLANSTGKQDLIVNILAPTSATRSRTTRTS